MKNLFLLALAISKVEISAQSFLKKPDDVVTPNPFLMNFIMVVFVVLICQLVYFIGQYKLLFRKGHRSLPSAADVLAIMCHAITIFWAYTGDEPLMPLTLILLFLIGLILRIGLLFTPRRIFLKKNDNLIS